MRLSPLDDDVLAFDVTSLAQRLANSSSEVTFITPIRRIMDRWYATADTETSIARAAVYFLECARWVLFWSPNHLIRF